MPLEPPLPIGIIGAGAVGLGLAAHLSKIVPVTVVARSNKLEQLKRSDPPPGVSYVGSLSALPLQVGSLWVCTKAFAAPDALKAAEFLFSPTCPVVVLSNGLGVYQECAELIARRAPIVRALVSTGFVETYDAVVQTGQLKVALAASSEYESSLRTVESILLAAGAVVTIESNVATAEWRKALLNVVTNPICTLVRSSNKALIEDSDLSQLAVQILGEARSVALKEGFSFPDLTNEYIFSLVKSVGDNRNSQLIDLERGRKSEIDYVLGRIIRIAKSYDLPVPRCETLYALCRATERNMISAPPNPAAALKPSPL